MEQKQPVRKPFMINQFEGKILKIVFASAGIPVFIVIGFLYSMFSDLVFTYLNSGMASHFLGEFFVLSCLLIVGYFVCVGLIAYRFSHRLVGAFPRILKELDGVVAGSSRNHIHIRKDDYAQELIERVNKLIDKLPG